MEVLPILGLKNTEEVKIDLKDKKLLSVLSGDARMPLSKIAKIIGLSKDAVKYRLKVLEKKQVLRGSRTIIDVEKLGYQSYHLFVKLRISEKENKEIVEKLSDLPYTRAVLKLYGNYDYEIAVISKTVKELDNIVNEITSILHSGLETIEVVTLISNISSTTFPRSFTDNIQIKNKIAVEKKKIKFDEIDKKDLEILKTIRNNAHVSLLDISRKINKSPDTVGYRIKNLQGNIIKGYTEVVNYQALGYNVYVLLLQINALDMKDTGKIRDLFNRNKSSFWAVKTIGKYNILSYIAIKKTDELYEIINDIRSSFPNKLAYYESLPAAAEYKYTYAPDCLFEN